MRYLRFAAGLTIFLVASTQAIACEALQESFRVLPPPGPASGPQLHDTGCTAAELEMFEKNVIAIARAQPVTDITLLHGTWLSDDVVGWVLGNTVAGQDILRFSEGEEDGMLHVEQSWMKVFRPYSVRVPWEADRGYTGLLAEGDLIFEQDGTWQVDYLNPWHYSGTIFESERSYDLYLKARVNYFERSVAFAIDGDTLVVRAQRFTQPVRELETVEATYTRVADNAPDRAMLLVAAMEISQGWHFDCFAHQLTDGAGPLIDAMAPVTPDEMEEILGPFIAMLNERADLFEAHRTGILNAQTARDRIVVVTDELLEHLSDPRQVALTDRLISSDLGCARPG